MKEVGLARGCYGIAMRLLWNCYGTAMGLLWDCGGVAVGLRWGCYGVGTWLPRGDDFGIDCYVIVMDSTCGRLRWRIPRADYVIVVAM